MCVVTVYILGILWPYPCVEMTRSIFFNFPPTPFHEIAWPSNKISLIPGPGYR